HAGRERGVAGGHRAHPVDEVGALGVAEQKAAGPGPQRGKDLVVVLERAEHQHAHRRGGRVGGDPPRHLDAVKTGQRDVDDHHVRAHLARQRDRRLAVGRAPHHRDPRRVGEQRLQPDPGQAVAVRDHHPDRPPPPTTPTAPNPPPPPPVAVALAVRESTKAKLTMNATHYPPSPTPPPYPPARA